MLLSKHEFKSPDMTKRQSNQDQMALNFVAGRISNQFNLP